MFLAKPLDILGKTLTLSISLFGCKGGVMNKFLSLLVSFTLLFTQMVPLGYAKGTNSCPWLSAGNLPSDVKTMITNTSSSKWHDPAAIKALTKWLSNHSNEAKNNSKCHAILSAGLDTLNEYCDRQIGAAYPEVCRGSTYAVPLMNIGGFSYYTTYYYYDEKLGWVERTEYVDNSQNGNTNGNSNRNRSGSRNGNGRGNGHGQGQGGGGNGNGHGLNVPFMQERTKAWNLFQEEDKDNLEDITELLQTLNYLIERGVDLGEFVKDAVTLFLDDRYQNGHSKPLSPSKLHAVFMAYAYQQRSNGRAGFYKVWQYAIYNCAGNGLCSIVHGEALSAIQARPEFDEFLQHELTSNGLFKNNLAKEKNLLELARIGASDLSNDEAKALLALYKGMDPEEANKKIIEFLAKRGAAKLGIELSEDDFSAAACLLVVPGTKALSVAPEILVAGLIGSLSLAAIYALGNNYMSGNVTFNANVDFDRTLMLFKCMTLATAQALAKTFEQEANEQYNAPGAVEQGDYTMEVGAVHWQAGTHGLIGSGAANEMNCRPDPGNTEGWGGGASTRRDGLNDKQWWRNRFPAGSNSPTSRIRALIDEINKATPGKLTQSSTFEELIHAGREARSSDVLSREGQQTLREMEKLGESGITHQNYKNSGGGPAYTKAVKDSNGNWKAQVEIAVEIDSGNLFSAFAPQVLESIGNAICLGRGFINNRIMLPNGGYLQYTEHEQNGGHIHYNRKNGSYICNESIKFGSGDDFIGLAMEALCEGR